MGKNKDGEDLRSEIRKVKETNRKLLSRLQTAEDQISSESSINKKVKELEEKMATKNKENKKLQSELNREKDIVKSTQKDSEYKGRKIIELENSYDQLNLKFEQMKVVCERVLFSAPQTCLANCMYKKPKLRKILIIGGLRT